MLEISLTLSIQYLTLISTLGKGYYLNGEAERETFRKHHRLSGEFKQIRQSPTNLSKFQEIVFGSLSLFFKMNYESQHSH